jgi:hypothetical protein
LWLVTTGNTIVRFESIKGSKVDDVNRGDFSKDSFFWKREALGDEEGFIWSKKGDQTVPMASQEILYRDALGKESDKDAYTQKYYKKITSGEHSEICDEKDVRKFCIDVIKKIQSTI